MENGSAEHKDRAEAKYQVLPSRRPAVGPVKTPNCARPHLAKHKSIKWQLLYLCMYVCVHVCMYVCMYAFMHVCMYVWLYVCVDDWLAGWLAVCMYASQTCMISDPPSLVEYGYVYACV